jgi:hypothetical protein
MVTSRDDGLMPPKKKTPVFTPEQDAKLIAAVDLLGRTGAKSFSLRYCEEEKPVIWMALGEYVRDGKTIFEVGAHTNPLVALYRLLDTLIDGGFCTHCKRPTGFSEDPDVMPLDEMFCWYQWDPERKTFRRGCEGDEK